MLHAAVVVVPPGGDEGQVGELAEAVVLPGVENGLEDAVRHHLPVPQPRDGDDGWPELVHVADQDVGVPQLHGVLGEHRHLRWHWRGMEKGLLQSRVSQALLPPAGLGPPAPPTWPSCAPLPTQGDPAARLGAVPRSPRAPGEQGAVHPAGGWAAGCGSNSPGSVPGGEGAGRAAAGLLPMVACERLDL